jgi:hypothetical protein
MFRPTRHSVEYILSKFAERGYTTDLLEYQNSFQKIEYTCDKHPDYKQSIRYNDLQQGKGCKYCGIENRSSKSRVDPNIVCNAFIDAHLIPMFDLTVYSKNKQKLPYLCPVHLDRGIQYKKYNVLTQGTGCPECGKDKKRGSNNYNWNGGSATLDTALRRCLTPWLKESYSAANYSCALTGSHRNLVIHHNIVSFKELKEKAMKALGIIATHLSIIAQYSEEQIRILAEYLLVLHYDSSFGVPIDKELHLKFHAEYGRINNTPEQFYEFKEKYLNGEYEWQK